MAKIGVAPENDASLIENLSISEVSHKINFQTNPDIQWKATPRPKIVIKEEDPTWPKNESNALSNQVEERQKSTPTRRQRIFIISNGQINGYDDKRETNSLDSEKEFYEHKAQKRSEIFKGIIFDEVGGTSLHDVMVSLGMVLFGFGVTIPFTLLPYHDLILFPEYWYEILLPGTLGGIMILGHCWLMA